MKGINCAQPLLTLLQQKVMKVWPLFRQRNRKADNDLFWLLQSNQKTWSDKNIAAERHRLNKSAFAVKVGVSGWEKKTLKERADGSRRPGKLVAH